MKNHRLEVDSIILEFGNKHILHNVYIKSETGKVTGLLGRNGSGKTCLLNIIFGELTVYGSSVRLDGQALVTDRRKPSDFRYLPQFNFIPLDLRVKQVFYDFNLDFASFLLAFPDFEKFYSSKLRALSSGERRIIEVYSILASDTKFCMLDEPFSQIMPVHTEALLQIFQAEKEYKGIILTDHMYQHVTDISDHLYVLSNGKTHLINNPDELRLLGYVN